MDLSFAQRSRVWRIEDQIQLQVERECWAWWGQTPHEVIPELAPIPDSKPNKISEFRFAVQMLLNP